MHLNTYIYIYIYLVEYIYFLTYIEVVVVSVPLQYESYFKARVSSRSVILGAVIENDVGHLVAWYVPARTSHTATTLFRLF